MKETSPATPVVETLSPISPERREALLGNQEGLSAEQLNELAPEIQAVEVRNDAPQTQPRDTLRLLAWNMERGREWRDGVRLLREHPALRDADVLFLSEMDFGMARSANEHTTREMAAALGMNYAFGVEFLELTAGDEEEQARFPDANQWGYHGNAILSRYALRQVRLVRFSGIEKWYADDQKRLGGRMALLAVIDLARPVMLVSTHLESGRDDQDHQAREQQMAILLDEIAKAAPDLPVLLGGDLNTITRAPLFGAMKRAGFLVEEANDLSRSTLQELHEGKVVPGEHHIDYLCVKRAEVCRDETSPAVVPAVYPPAPAGRMISDHAIVTARVKLPEK